MNSLKVHKGIKSIIFLKKAGGKTLASLIIFDTFNNSHLQAQKLLTGSEVSELLSRKGLLANQNIFIIEENASQSVVLIGSKTPEIRYGEMKNSVPSPYVSKIFRQAEFFSTQKTRGPNWIR